LRKKYKSSEATSKKNITKLKEENQKIKIKIINNKSWNQPV